MNKSRYSCCYPFEEKDLPNAKKTFLIKVENVFKIFDIQNEQELIKGRFSKYFPLGPTKEPVITLHSALGGDN